MPENALADPTVERFYRTALGALVRSQVPFMVGGAYALRHYTGICRLTKDLDVFARPQDVPALLASLEQAGYQTELTDPTWLAKAFHGEDYVDLIFSSGNGLVRIDQSWLDHAQTVDLFGWQIKLVSPEEMVWSKVFIQERERYDGADVAHLILKCGERLDWQRLLERLAEHWPVLFAHLVLFRYSYPTDRQVVPDWVLEELQGRLERCRRTPAPAERVCRGLYLSRTQYAIDVTKWGYAPPPGLPLRQE